MISINHFVLIFACMFSSSRVGEMAEETSTVAPALNQSIGPVQNERYIERTLVAISLGLLALSGISCYAVICYILIKHKRDHFSNPFYTLALGLAGGDLMHLIPILLLSVPELILGEGTFSYEYEAAVGFICDAGFWVIAPVSVIICVNRYIALYHNSMYYIVFSQPRVKAMISASYALGFGLPTLMYGCSCFYLFGGYTFYFHCGESCAQFAINVNLVIAGILTISPVVIYGLIMLRFREFSNDILEGSEQKQSMKKKERALVIQCFFILLFFLIYQFLFWYLWFVDERHRLYNYIQYLAATINSCVNPFLYSIFSSDIRAKLRGHKIVKVKITTASNRVVPAVATSVAAAANVNNQ